MLKQLINFPSLVYYNDIWKWSNLLQTPNNVKCMPAVYEKIKKKEAYKRASYTTIQKLLLQNRIARY